MEFDAQMKKRMRFMLIGLGILFGAIFLYKGFGTLMLKWYMYSNRSPTVTVSALKVGYSYWEPEVKAVASLRAIRGVDVTAELAGMVRTIYFTPGTNVAQQSVLVQLNADTDIAALHSLEANAELARITYERDKAQYAVQAVSKQTVDSDAANLKSLRAQVAQQAATVAKKTIRAPFDGRLGIRLVNIGQWVNPGDTIVNLQTLDPIYADFTLPQQQLPLLQLDQTVKISTDAYPGRTFYGKVTTINPAVDSNTRNVTVEATIDNPRHELNPGMFAKATVIVGNPRRLLTVPQAAISFNPYGELVYVVNETNQKVKGKPVLAAKQSFVTTGEARGDQIVIQKGLKAGQVIVTSGQLKLKNGSHVTINNSATPSDKLKPETPDDH